MDPPESAWSRLDADLERKQAGMYRKRGNRFKLLSLGLGLLLLSSVAYYYISPINNNNNNNKSAVRSHDSSRWLNNLRDSTIKVAPNLKDETDNKFSTNNNHVSSNHEEGAPVSERGLGTRNTAPLAVVPRSSSTGNYKSVANKAETTKQEKENLNSEEKQSSGDDVINQSPVATNAADRNSNVAKEVADDANDLSGANPDGLNDEQASCSAKSNPSLTNDNSGKSDGTPPGDNSKSKISRWSVDAFYSPNYTGNHLTGNSGGYYDNANNYSNSEQHDYSFAAGLDLRYHISHPTGALLPALRIQHLLIPLHFSTIYVKYGADDQLHYQYPTACGNIEIPNNGYKPLYYGDSVNTSAKCSQVVEFISIPVTVRYHVGEGRIKFFRGRTSFLPFSLFRKKQTSIMETMK